MEFKEWLASAPKHFPALFYKAPPDHNPIIGTNQIHTISNVHDVLRFVSRAIVNSQRNELEFSANETSGFCQIIDVCGDALAFETICRPDGGEPDEDSEEAGQAQ